MDLASLGSNLNSIKKSKRLGRGQASGKGGTSTKGHKGDKSRSGHKLKIGFEGGQMPLQRRIPKYGFRPLNKVTYVPVNLSLIQSLIDENKLSPNDEITQESFLNLGIISKNQKIKILADGTLNSKISIKAEKFSTKAIQIIESLGGSVSVI